MCGGGGGDGGGGRMRDVKRRVHAQRPPNAGAYGEGYFLGLELQHTRSCMDPQTLGANRTKRENPNNNLRWRS